MPHDPSTGPIPRDVFASLANAPFGKALETIRQYDPLHARAEGEPIKWRVILRRKMWERGTVIVEAASETEAESMADEISCNQIDWSFSHSEDEREIIAAEPMP